MINFSTFMYFLDIDVPIRLFDADNAYSLHADLHYNGHHQIGYSHYVLENISHWKKKNGATTITCYVQLCDVQLIGIEYYFISLCPTIRHLWLTDVL